MLSGITLGCLLMLTTEGFSNSRRCKIRCEDGLGIRSATDYSKTCYTLGSEECQRHGGVKKITDLTQQAENREQREETRARRAEQAAAAIAAVAKVPVAPITNHACGRDSVACTIKSRLCIFRVDRDDQKIVILPSEEITEGPNYKNGGVSYACMKKDAYAKLPFPDTTDRGA